MSNNKPKNLSVLVILVQFYSLVVGNLLHYFLIVFGPENELPTSSLEALVILLVAGNIGIS